MTNVNAINTLLNSPIVLAGLVTVALALLAGVQLVIVTGINARVAAAAEMRAAKIRAEEKAVEWKRQDDVADKVATAAKAVVDAQAAAELRQDAVAKQAATAAELLRKSQVDSNNRTEEVARLAAIADERVHKQLVALDAQGEKIHALVNSEMTAARTDELDAKKLTLLTLRRLLALNDKLELPTDPDDLKEIAKVEARIAELDKILLERREAQQKVDAEARARAALSASVPIAPPAAPGPTTATMVEAVKEAVADASGASLDQIAKNTAAIDRNTR